MNKAKIKIWLLYFEHSRQHRITIATNRRMFLLSSAFPWIFHFEKNESTIADHVNVYHTSIYSYCYKQCVATRRLDNLICITDGNIKCRCLILQYDWRIMDKLQKVYVIKYHCCFLRILKIAQQFDFFSIFRFSLIEKIWGLLE